jgi:hypothetical protein
MNATEKTLNRQDGEHPDSAPLWGLIDYGYGYGFGPGSWRAVRVTSKDQPCFELHIPALQRFDGTGIVQIPLKHWADAKFIHKKIFEQSGCLIDLDLRPGLFNSIWNGKKETRRSPGWDGIRSRLSSDAQSRDESAADRGCK